jgi:signal peptidase I
MNPYLKAAIWVVVVVGAAVGLGALFFDTATVPDQSMAPTMWAGDRVLVLKRGSVHRGDVVICEHPEFPDETIVGRVIGLPGDAVQISRGQLLLNGDVLHEEVEGPFVYMDRTSSEEAFEFVFTKKMQIIGGTISYLLFEKDSEVPDLPKTVVQSGYWVLGDNRAGGLDSRTFGEVHESLCSGRAFFIYSAVKGLGDADTARRAFTFVNNPPHD